MLGAGTWQIPNGDAHRVVLEALEMGYRLIDTAAAYRNEEGVGRAVRESGIVRGDIFLTSSIAAEIKGYRETLDAFDQTMEALGLEYLDLYLIHAPWPWSDMGGDYTAQNLESWRAMEEIYRSGRARAIGRVKLHAGALTADSERLHSRAACQPDFLLRGTYSARLRFFL